MIAEDDQVASNNCRRSQGKYDWMKIRVSPHENQGEPLALLEGLFLRQGR